jgi:hypothetical protein
MDHVLHRERTRRDHSKVTYRAALDTLPPGAMVILPGTSMQAALIHDGYLFAWSPGGYTPGSAITATTVEVLTPRASVAALAAGYRPDLHRSAHR